LKPSTFLCFPILVTEQRELHQPRGSLHKRPAAVCAFLDELRRLYRLVGVLTFESMETGRRAAELAETAVFRGVIPEPVVWMH
jgi:hypothetical protein